MGGVDAVAPVVVLVDDGYLELVALVEVYLNGEGVELALHGLEEVVVLRPGVAPVVVRIAREAAGQHPGPLVRDGGLPGDENGGVLSDRGAHVVGDNEGGRGVIALDDVALFAELGLGDGLALLGVDLGEHGGAVAVVEGDLEAAGGVPARLAAGGERKDHRKGERKAEQFAHLFHFLSSLNTNNSFSSLAACALKGLA